MGAFKDLTGMRFNRLTVIEQAGRDKYKKILWKCLCDCGSYTITHGRDLVSGNTKTCGCLNLEVKRQKAKYGGLSTDNRRIYTIWKGMIARCYNPDIDCYGDYGGRGINVCAEWHKYEAFRDWALSNGYSDKLTIDRIDVNGDYCPNNCRWATIYEQNNNKRTSKYISFNGKTGTVREFADEYGLAYSCLYERLKLGWSTEDALLTPSRKDV